MKTVKMADGELKKMATVFKDCAECLNNIQKTLLTEKKLLAKISSLKEGKSTEATEVYQKMVNNMKSGKTNVEKMKDILSDKEKYHLLLLEDQNGTPFILPGN